MFLIMYDISDGKIRNKVYKKLISEGYEAIQYSVFCGLRNPKDIDDMWKLLNNWIDKDESGNILVVSIPKYKFKTIYILGNSNLDIDYIVADKQSLFF